MHVVVLGATGLTGRHVVTQALERGHQVTALVRTPSKLDDLVQQQNQHQPQSGGRLDVVTADVLSVDSLSAAFSDAFKKSSNTGGSNDGDAVGRCAVVSALGFSRRQQPVTGYTQSMQAVYSAVQQCGIPVRLVAMTSYYTDPDSARGKAGFLVNWVLIPLIRPVLVNMAAMEKWLQDSEDTDLVTWTVVRPPGLTRASLREGAIHERVEEMMVEGASMSMPRANVAKFMLDQLDSQKYIRQIVAIGM